MDKKKIIFLIIIVLFFGALIFMMKDIMGKTIAPWEKGKTEEVQK